MNAQPKQINPILKLHPKQSEAKKVSVDDGYTQIPNELLDAILETDLTKPQIKLVLGVIRKTFSWHKEMDWICNEQLAEISRLCDDKEASRIKNELIKMCVLVKDGRKIGLNLYISEWQKKQNPMNVQSKKVVQKQVKNPMNVQQKSNECTTTKETITKEKINNEFTNVNSVQQSEISLPKKTKSEPVDYQGVMEEFNRAVENTPIPKIRAMSDERKRSVHTLAKILRKEFGGYTPKHFADYFNDFVQQASNRKDRFYFGGLDGSGWVANFGYIIRSKTFYNTWEDSL
ncbi:replication protein [Mannheimia bovis]|uniref:Replication protein n=1 Tax=Mannheimia bovis TaxID=2770636 RepID=A0A7H1C0N8_9PAST|nr:replication protein [Mannheimia bovis]QNS14543.1 replication protein [Mannheimia bovis]